MGREIKRVALDFDCPLDTTWKGYLNPHLVPACPTCEGRGETASLRALSRLVSTLMLAGADSLERTPDGRPGTIPNWPGSPYKHSWPHPYVLEAGVADPGTTLHELTAGLAGRPPTGPFGHDSCDHWSAAKKIIAAAGLPETWGDCPACGGSGEAQTPEAAEIRALSEAWTPTEPPAGDGWQLWQTVSEGGPVSPVFPTAEGLAGWISKGGQRWQREGMDYDAALRWVTGPGWAPSAVMVDGQMVNPMETP